MASQVSGTANPHPATDALHFTLTDVQHDAMHIVLHDLQGRLRVSSSLRYSEQEVELPVSELLEAGLYTYTVQTASGTASGKVVVQRWYVVACYWSTNWKPAKLNHTDFKCAVVHFVLHPVK